MSIDYKRLEKYKSPHPNQDRRAGRTFDALVEAVRALEQYTTVFLVMHERRHIPHILPDLQMICNELGRGGFEYSRQWQTLRFPNGRQLKLFSQNNPEALTDNRQPLGESNHPLIADHMCNYRDIAFLESGRGRMRR